MIDSKVPASTDPGFALVRPWFKKQILAFEVQWVGASSSVGDSRTRDGSIRGGLEGPKPLSRRNDSLSSPGKKSGSNEVKIYVFIFFQKTSQIVSAIFEFFMRDTFNGFANSCRPLSVLQVEHIK